MTDKNIGTPPTPFIPTTPVFLDAKDFRIIRNGSFDIDDTKYCAEVTLKYKPDSQADIDFIQYAFDEKAGFMVYPRRDKDGSESITVSFPTIKSNFSAKNTLHSMPWIDTYRGDKNQDVNIYDKVAALLVPNESIVSYVEDRIKCATEVLDRAAKSLGQAPGKNNDLSQKQGLGHQAAWNNFEAKAHSNLEAFEQKAKSGQNMSSSVDKIIADCREKNSKNDEWNSPEKPYNPEEEKRDMELWKAVIEQSKKNDELLARLMKSSSEESKKLGPLASLQPKQPESTPAAPKEVGKDAEGSCVKIPKFDFSKQEHVDRMLRFLGMDDIRGGTKPKPKPE